MQTKSFPNIQSSKDFKPTSEEHLSEVLEYIQSVHEKDIEMNKKMKNEGKKVVVDDKVLKKLQILTKESSKIGSIFPEMLMSIVRELVEFFSDIPHPHIITLITNTIGPDMKFQAISSEPSVTSQQPTRIQDFPIIALPMAEESIIALPDSRDCITVAIHQAGDVGVQQNRQANEQYQIDDDKIVAEYLQKPFKTVKRQGISDSFEKVAQFLLDQLIQKLLLKDSNIMNLHIDSVTAILKLIEYISPSLYTYYFLSLVNQLTKTLLQSFSPSLHTNLPNSILALDLQQKIKRTEYQELIYAVRSMTERWKDHKGDFNIELWEWHIEQKMVVSFLESTTSEKQLHAVKTLIDRSRKVQYNSYSVLGLQELVKFIQTNHIIEQIYKAENHPEVIIKGKEIFEFMAKHHGLNHYKIDVVFELIPKSNQNICKALYSTLQATGHTNLQNNREYIMTKISSLPRSSLFYNQTFTLVQALILLAPIQQICESLRYVYQIIFSHYFGLKPQLKHKLLNIYFQVYLMGVEEGEFDTNEEKIMIVLKPFLSTQHQIHSRLTFLIVDKFIQKLKEHISKKIGPKCKKIINFSIELLFKKYKIHQKQSKIDQITEQNNSENKEKNKENKEQRQFREIQLGLVKQLLEACDKQMTKSFLSQKQLWQLIEQESYFGRFLSYYSSTSQLYLLEKMISKASISEKDIKNIIESYYFMDKDVKDQIFSQIYHMFYETQDFFIKEKLVEFIVKVGSQNAEILVAKVMKEIKNLHKYCEEKQSHLENLLAAIMEVKQALALNDKQGCGSYPAFKYLTNDYSVKLKVLNMVDIFNPTNFQLQEKNYKTLFDVVKGILLMLDKSLKQIKLKIDKNQKYVTLQELKQKLNQLSPYREISLTIQESQQCQWYDQSLLISKSSKQMNPQIIQILRQIFNHYSEQVNNQKRLFKEGACRIFQKATNSQNISVNDMRILHLFNNYSDTGEYLTVHQWINFYYQSALVNPYLVISNLKNLGYADAFQSASEMIENFTLETQNHFRQFFAQNQQVYQKFFQVFGKLRQIKKTQLSDKISQLTLDLLSQLPKYDKLQNEVNSQFIQGNLKENLSKEKDKMVEQKDEYYQIKQSVEKVYFMTLMLGHQLDKVQKVSLNGNGHKLQQKGAINMEATVYSLQRLEKVKQFASHKMQVSFQELLDNKKHPQIDPLNLSYQQNISILVLQNLGHLLTRPLFKQINGIKNNLKQEVSELIPFSVLDLQEKVSFKSISIESLNPISEKLCQLSAINGQLLPNYASVLLQELLSYKSSKILRRILLKFVLQQNVLFSKVQSLSKLSNQLVYLLSDSVEGLIQWYSLTVLDQFKSNLFIEEKGSAVEYFKTLDQLLLIETDSSMLNQTYQLIYSILGQQTSTHSYAEFFQSKHHSQTIEGLLLCLKTLSSTFHFNQSPLNKLSLLAQSLLTNFVLSQKSQSYLYTILSSVNRKEPQHNLTFAYKKFTDLKLKRNSKLNTDNQSQCGIYNLGCICYINSVFQQLFHLTQFSDTIMKLPANLKQTEKYLVEFQKVFYGLKYSKRAFLITNKFCQNYTDYTGQPINIKQQHDADQFLNNLLDNIEKTSLNTYHIPKQQTITRQLFKGSMSNVITCQNCFTHKANHEEFYVLSLEIKNQSSLVECLDKMVEPEVICDYYCNTCDRKVDEIQKFRKFNTLPSILFIHFQRLVFDLETFTKIKLDHPVNFAEEIDLQNYFQTDQSQPCKYRLLGFIVHFGNSEGGHYISLIKGKDNHSWKKYDDSRITKWFWKAGIHQKDNAYLLIYEKVDHIVEENGQMQDETLQNVQVNEKILQEVTEDNVLLGKEITVIRPDFGRFLISQLQKCSRSQSESNQCKEEGEQFENDLLKTKLIWKYLKMIEQAKSVGFSQSLPLKESELELLAMRFIEHNRSPQTAQHFLDIAVEQEIVKTICQSGQKKLRQVFSILLANIVSTWNNYFSHSSYMIPVQDNETIRKLMNQIQNALTEVGKNYSKMDEYFQLVFMLSKVVVKFREYMKEMNLIPKLVHFVMHKDSKLLDNFGLYPMNAPNNKKVPCFNIIIEIVSIYFEEFPQLMNNELVNLCLGTKGFQFYKKLYEDRYENYMKLNTILCKFCSKNFELSNKVIDELILNKTNRFSKDDFYIMAYLDLIYCMLTIKDQFKQYRMLRVLGIPTLLIESCNDQEIMIRKKKQRIIGYWSNYIVSGDEIIIPFLEQLYNNRDELTYFQITGIVYLLQLMKQNKEILQYVTSLPSPCLFYQNYLTWIVEFIKNSLKPVDNKSMEKIDLKATLNKISVLLEEIQEIKLNSEINLEKQKKIIHYAENMIGQHCANIISQNDESQKIEHEIQENNKVQAKNQFLDTQDWLNRNERFIFGQIVEKSETRLINQPIYLASSEQFYSEQSSSHQQPIFSISITYCTLNTMHIKNLVEFSQEVLSIQDIIQPSQNYLDLSQIKNKNKELLQSYLSSEKVENSLLQISFSGQNYQLQPYKHKSYVLNVKFLSPPYPYELLISVDKLIIEECKLIVPSPLRNLPLQLFKDPSFIDSQVQMCIKITLISLKNNKPQNQDKMEESQQPKNQSNHKNHAQNGSSSKKNLNSIQEEYPSMDQVYGSDAYMQQAQQPYKTQDKPKQQLCIECPFCGYIAHQFASRCPGCNEEWGYFA